jgi:hypothetical protein
MNACKHASWNDALAATSTQVMNSQILEGDQHGNGRKGAIFYVGRNLFPTSAASCR